MWNKKKLSAFFRENFNKEIILKELVGVIIIKGKIENFEKLDLCNRSLFEILIVEKFTNKRIFITLHDNFVGVKYYNNYTVIKKTKQIKTRILLKYNELVISYL